MRRWISGGLMLTLLFAQFALAAYACPKDGAVSAGQPVALFPPVSLSGNEANPTVDAMPDCHGMLAGMDRGQPQLCHAHCSGDAQALPSSAGQDLTPNLTHTAVALFGLAYASPSLRSPSRSLILTRQATSPPAASSFPALYLALQVLRI